MSFHGLAGLLTVCLCAGFGSVLGGLFHQVAGMGSALGCSNSGHAVGFGIGGFIWEQFIHRKLRPHYAEFIRNESKAASGPDV